MAIKEKDAFELLGSLPEESQQVFLAISVMTARITTLDPDDRNDLFQLMTAWSKTDDPEERTSIKFAMLEILTQGHQKAKQSVKEGSPIVQEALHPGSKKWAIHVGSKIRKLREQAGLTQDQLSEKAGIPQSHVSRLETAAYTATHMTLEKIAKALGVTVGDIDPCLD